RQEVGMHSSIASVVVTIDAPATKVWDALVNPKVIARYMFGTEVTSEFKAGSPITWRGLFHGRQFVDRGIILEIVPFRRLVYTHASNGDPTKRHTVNVSLSEHGDKTKLVLEQDGNADHA